MGKVVAHVVANKRQHGEGVAAYHAGLAGGGGCGLTPHGGGHVHAFLPVARFSHQRHGGGAAAAKDEGINCHAFRVVPRSIECGVVGGGDGEAGVGVRRLCSSLFGNRR